MNYFFNRIQIKMLHLSEIDSLLGNQGLDFLFVKIQCFSLLNPVQPFMKVFREQASNIIDFKTSAVLIQMNSDKEIFVFVLNVHNDILRFCFISISEHGKRILQSDR